MIFQLQNLSQATTSLLPDRCSQCAWWQGQDCWTDSREARAWRDAAEDAIGHWGKLAMCDGRMVGMVQFGPAQLFPRSAMLSCGPVTPGSILFTCSLITDHAFESVRKSLVLAMLGELERQGFEVIEAFAYLKTSSQNICHLFQDEFLRDCGFYPLRSSGGIELMRLQLGGVQPVRPQVHKIRRGLLDRLKRPAPTPVPAALCRSHPCPRAHCQ